MKCSGFMNQDENIQKSKTMTEEKLVQANELEKEITDLKNHRDYVKTERDDAYEGPRCKMVIESNFEAPQKVIQPEFMPVALPEFVEMYLTKVEKQIKKLEEEFEKL